MSSEVSFTKRAAAELSRCFNGLTVSRSSSSKKAGPTANGSAGSSGIKLVNSTSSLSNKDGFDSDSKTRQQNQKQQSSETSNGMWKEEKVLKYGTITVPQQSTNEGTINPLYQSELFMKLQSKANSMYSGVAKNFMDSEAIITQSSTIINPFKQDPLTPSRRPPPRAPPKTWRARRKNYLLNLRKPVSLFELFHDVKFLRQFFTFFTSKDRCILAQVCLKWKDVLYAEPEFWKGLLPIIYYNDLRRILDKPSPVSPDPNLISSQFRTNLRNQESMESNSSLSDSSFDEVFNYQAATIKANLYASIEKRGFDCVCLYAATDNDVFDFASRVSPSALRLISFGSIRCSTITDKGLDIFLASLSQSLRKLEIIGCNEISDAGLWTSLVPHLESLLLRDCINVGDETIAATSQMLPELRELCLQTYHMSDASTTFFASSTMRGSLRTLRLENCWEMTNQGVLNIAHSLPQLEKLSLLGCSKITDDAIELISENVKALKTLDLSWCARISDAALEYIACDLADTLCELNLDRCPHITDIGLGYIATMPQITTLSLRWCHQIRDFGLQTICSMRALKVLSLAGCSQLTVNGLSCLVQMQQLDELELTNCPGATKELVRYLTENLPKSCFIIHG